MKQRAPAASVAEATRYAITLAKIVKERRGTSVEEFKLEPHQVPPAKWLEAAFLWWLLRAGRGSGKTQAGAAETNRRALERPTEIGIFGQTMRAARLLSVSGPAGLLRLNPEIRFNRQDGELFWPNGSHATIYGAFTPEDVERVRGHQWGFTWLDELASWRQLSEVWEQIDLGLRLGTNPQGMITTTLKPRKLIRELLVDSDVTATQASTFDNPHTSERYRARVRKRYAGTRIEAQELMGDLVEDLEGALVSFEDIAAGRVSRPDNPAAWAKFLAGMRRVVVSIDPAGSTSKAAHETGIAVVGHGHDDDYYVIEAVGNHWSPAGWSSRAIELHDRYEADTILGEINFGGDMVAHTIRTAPGGEHLNVEVIRASRGKAIRAEPAALLYEQHRIHHVAEAGGHFEELEEQLTTFPIAHEADDRLDALVWAIVLMTGSARSTLSLDDSLEGASGAPIMGALGKTNF